MTKKDHSGRCRRTPPPPPPPRNWMKEWALKIAGAASANALRKVLDSLAEDGDDD